MSAIAELAVKPDPPVSPTGRCAGPGCTKQRGRIPKDMVGRDGGILAAELAVDPFCSVKCCRRWHGTDLPETDLERGQRVRREREAQR